MDGNMSQAVVEKLKGGGNSHWTKYTSEELKELGWWNCTGQGNQQARGRGKDCVVVSVADEETALRFTALFVRQFAIPSCVHWDGNLLSMYCGDAGSGCAALKHRVQEFVSKHNSQVKPFLDTDLFASS